MTFYVDFRDSLWSSDPGKWAPHALAAVKAAIEGTGPPVFVWSVPSGVHRMGRIEIGRGLATGQLCVLWDDELIIADRLGVADTDEFRNLIPGVEAHGSPGVEMDFNIKAGNLTALMQGLEHKEGDLLDEDRECWQLIEQLALMA